MCNRYTPPVPDGVAQRWYLRPWNTDFPPAPLFPTSPAPFTRAVRDSVEVARETMVNDAA